MREQRYKSGPSDSRACTNQFTCLALFFSFAKWEFCIRWSLKSLLGLKSYFLWVLKMGTKLQIELLALDCPELTLHTHTNSVLAPCRNKVHKASSISILALWTDLWAFSLTSRVGLYGSNLQMTWYLLGLLSEECPKHKKMLVFYFYLWLHLTACGTSPARDWTLIPSSESLGILTTRPPGMPWYLFSMPIFSCYNIIYWRDFPSIELPCHLCWISIDYI